MPISSIVRNISHIRLCLHTGIGEQRRRIRIASPRRRRKAFCCRSSQHRPFVRNGSGNFRKSPPLALTSTRVYRIYCPNPFTSERGHTHNGWVVSSFGVRFSKSTAHFRPCYRWERFNKWIAFEWGRTRLMHIVIRNVFSFVTVYCLEWKLL